MGRFGPEVPTPVGYSFSNREEGGGEGGKDRKERKERRRRKERGEKEGKKHSKKASTH